MKEVGAVTLSEHRGESPKPTDEPAFPPYNTDEGIFENNLLEVMQFAVNHTTFDPNEELDAALLAALEPLGVVPGKTFDPSAVRKSTARPWPLRRSASTPRRSRPGSAPTATPTSTICSSRRGR